MTAAIPAAAERVAAGRVAGAASNAGAVAQAKKRLTGSASRTTGPANVPDREDSRVSASRPRATPVDHGRGARSRRSFGPRTAARPLQPHVRVLVAEWILAVILIVVTVPSEKGSQGYPQTMSTIMLRLSGLTGIFFALSLIGTVERAARFAIWFGFIIDLGILYHAATSGSGKALASVFSGKSVLSDGVTLAADYSDKSAAPQPTPYSPPQSAGTPGGSGGAELSPTYPGGAGTTIPTPGIPGGA